MTELIAKSRELAALLGPNLYIQAAAIAIAFVVLGKLAELLISRVVGRLTGRSANALDDEIIKLIHRPVFLTVVLIGLAIASRHLQLPEMAEKVTLGILHTFIILIWFNLANNLASLLILTARRRSRSKFVQSGMLTLLQNAIKIALIALLIYFVFVAWGISLAPWLASAGIVGLALSFAAKDTLSNLFAGVSIIADAPYKTGDFIILDSGERGIVTHIGLRSTRLLTRDDVEITIPNGVLGNSKIINEAGGPSTKHRIRIAVGVAYGSDIDHVIAVLEKVAADHNEVCDDPAPRVRFRKFGDSSLDFELLCWIDRPVDRGRLLHELNCAVYKAFTNESIEIPYPQRDLHVRTMPAANN